MKCKQILFTDVRKAELVDEECKEPAADEVMVKLAFSSVSCGTERANFMGDVNINPYAPSKDNIPVFPRRLGYSSSGYVYKVGSDITDLKVGDRVSLSYSEHKSYFTAKRIHVNKIPFDDISLQEAAVVHISTFPSAAIRKTKVEFGESAIVMGLGLLGMLAVKLLRAAGAVPIIAVDPIASKRKTAIEYGADYALDPFEKDFAKKVKELTNGKGANVAIEVTGNGKALDQVLDCMARFGRVALLGCTRDPNFTIDYYRKIHFPGITLVGAHTRARPEFESHPGFWTNSDDVESSFKLIHGKRMDIMGMIAETHSPNEAQSVYDRLADDKEFPLVQFDWSKLTD